MATTLETFDQHPLRQYEAYYPVAGTEVPVWYESRTVALVDAIIARRFSSQITYAQPEVYAPDGEIGPWWRSFQTVFPCGITLPVCIPAKNALFCWNTNLNGIQKDTYVKNNYQTS